MFPLLSGQGQVCWEQVCHQCFVPLSVLGPVSENRISQKPFYETEPCFDSDSGSVLIHLNHLDSELSHVIMLFFYLFCLKLYELKLWPREPASVSWLFWQIFHCLAFLNSDLSGFDGSSLCLEILCIYSRHFCLYCKFHGHFDSDLS